MITLNLFGGCYPKYILKDYYTKITELPLIAPAVEQDYQAMRFLRDIRQSKIIPFMLSLK